MYTRSIGRLATEVCCDLPNSEVIVVFRGAVLKAGIEGDKLVPSKFIKFVGASSTFAILRNDGHVSICVIKVLKEPIIYRNKVREPGLFKLCNCRELVLTE